MAVIVDPNLTVTWAPIRTDDGDAYKSTGLERFQQLPVGVDNLQKLLEMCQGNDGLVHFSSGHPATIGVSRTLVTAFVPYIEILFNTIQTAEGTVVRMDEFNRDTLQHLADYINDGQLPSSTIEQLELYPLAQRLQHGWFETCLVKSLIAAVKRKYWAETRMIMTVASSSPDCLLYSKLVEYLAIECGQHDALCQFIRNGCMDQQILLDVLLRDDLFVSSEMGVLEIINVWLSRHSSDCLEEFTGVVRIPWLPQITRNNYFARLAARGVNGERIMKNSKPRLRFLRHVHLIHLELLQTPQPHELIALTCAMDGMPCRALTRVRVPKKPHEGVVIMEPFKAIYLDKHLSKYGPVAIVKCRFALVELFINNREWEYKLLNMDAFAAPNAVASKLFDICACPRGLVVYVETETADKVFLIKDPSLPPEILFVSGPVFDARVMYVPYVHTTHELLKFGCARANVTFVQSLENITTHIKVENALNIDTRDVSAYDVGEMIAFASQLGYMPADSTALGKIDDDHEFTLRCSVDQRDVGRLTIDLAPIGGGANLLSVRALRQTQYLVGFLPRAMFTEPTLCEILPIM